MMVVPFAQVPFWGGEVVVRSSLSRTEVAAAIRTETHDIDKDLPVTDVESFPEAMHASVAEPRFRTVLLGLFSAIALLLAAIGIFGVISFSISRRTREIGVRIALGASPTSIRHLVIGESAKLVAVWTGCRHSRSSAVNPLFVLAAFRIKATDPLTFIGVALLLMLVALAAAYLPARRAIRIDPMVALRCE